MLGFLAWVIAFADYIYASCIDRWLLCFFVELVPSHSSHFLRYRTSTMPRQKDIELTDFDPTNAGEGPSRGHTTVSAGSRAFEDTEDASAATDSLLHTFGES